MEVYEELETAMGLIQREDDWTQGQWGMGGGPSCAVGAVGRAVGAFDLREACAAPAVAALESAIGRRLISGDEPGDQVEFFNDSHSHAEVLDLFRKAIREAKAKAGIRAALPAPREETANV
jgi:hypothetical protein